MVGSYGRLGILTEVTLKVFPQPQACATLMAELADLEQCVAAAQRLLAKPLPVAALDMDLNGKLFVRFAGPAPALGNVLTRAAEVIDSPGETLDSAIDESQFWRQRSEWVAEQDAGAGRWLVRIATTLDSLAELVRCLAALAVTNVRLSCAGSVAWISVDAAAGPELDQFLQQQKLSAVAIKGATDKLIVLGDQRWVAVAGRIQKAMDPHGKFVAF
jgi:FAD/FMN-containing dehydrogenase